MCVRYAGPAVRRRERIATALLLAAISVLSGCEGRAPEPSAEPGGAASPPVVARRVIEPPPGETSTAALPRARVGRESRLVLGSEPRVVLEAREEVRLGESLVVPIELPATLAPVSGVRIDVWASARDEDSRDLSLLEIHSEATHRTRLEAEPLVLSAEDLARSRRYERTIEVPGDLRGLPALVSAVARPLPDAAKVLWRSRPLEVGASDRLIFGYAVEREGWSPGWPPVTVRVYAEPVDGGVPRLLFERALDPARREGDRRWFDASIPLDALPPGPVVFRFESEALAPIAGTQLARSYAVVSAPELEAGPAGVAPDAPDPAQRNVILISLDTLRARSVGAYGRERATTPILDARVAGEGALVRRALAPVPYTPPAHMSMLTGLEPCVHGVIDRFRVLAADQLTLAELLRAAGYRTAAVTEDAYVVAASGFARGFDHYFEEFSDLAASPGFARETFARGARWLAEVGDRPFFLFLHTYQVHRPYAPPEEYAGLFADDGLEGPQVRERLRSDLADYEREIRYTDDLLGGLLDALDRLNLTQRTILVVTSDHGEGFGEHLWARHGFDAHEEAIHVPLLVRAPGLVPAGLVVDESVGLMDLVPTLLELVGVAEPPGLQGRSFASLLRGEPSRFQARPLVSEAEGNVAVSSGDWKLLEVREGKVLHLYDLAADPGERSNVAPEHPGQVADLERALERHDAFCEPWRSARPESHYVTPGRRPPAWLVNRDEIEAKLRALGYIDDHSLHLPAKGMPPK